jgi:hypothetical protein
MAFLGYYRSLFTIARLEGLDHCLSGIARKITPYMNASLIKPCTIEEVSMALNQMGPFKSAGPDGFSAAFYQQNWSSIGDEVCRAVSSFIHVGYMDEEVNFIQIVLIPKKNNLVFVTDYRPISLCNVIYKITFKVLANRLKVVLPLIISPNQSAFIPGQLITDNILAAYETLHSMQTRHWGKTGYVAVKLDMSKAYDRVDWYFLDVVMRRIGFSQVWRGLIMQCISSVHFSILINGQPTESFKPTRGIRQGDPISPYLFIICAEALSTLLSQAATSG